MAVLLVILVILLVIAVAAWPARRWSKRMEKQRPAPSPQQELVGMVGEVVTSCRPRGQVMVRGELWEALCPEGAEPGAAVRVEAVDALTLTVAPRS